MFESRIKKSKSKPIPITGRGSLQGCEMLRIPHCLDNRLTDGGKVVGLTHRPRSAPQKHYFSASRTHFSWSLSKPQGRVWLEGLGKLRKFIHLIRSGTRDLLACSKVPQPLRYRVPPLKVPLAKAKFCITPVDMLRCCTGHMQGRTYLTATGKFRFTSEQLPWSQKHY
jgi:hypothetical protein